MLLLENMLVIATAPAAPTMPATAAAASAAPMGGKGKPIKVGC
jgi:hypothetical protein